LVKKEKAVYQESRLRSILKACSWRFVATSTTFAITYLVSGKVDFAVTVASVEVVSKMLFYYLHERAWQLVPRGTIRALLHKQRPSGEAGDGL